MGARLEHLPVLPERSRPDPEREIRPRVTNGHATFHADDFESVSDMAARTEPPDVRQPGAEGPADETSGPQLLAIADGLSRQGPSLPISRTTGAQPPAEKGPHR